MIYKCEVCGGEFESADDWTDDDARREFVDKFPSNNKDVAIVCDDCYNVYLFFSSLRAHLRKAREQQ